MVQWTISSFERPEHERGAGDPEGFSFASLASLGEGPVFLSSLALAKKN